MDKDVLEIFSGFSFDDMYNVILFSVLLIVVFASCIEPFYATNIETILMSKTDALKRSSLMYIILFIVVGVMNYVIVLDEPFIAVCFLFVVLILVFYAMVSIANKFNKFERIYLKCKEYIGLVIIIVLSPVITYICSSIIDIKLVNCVILCALAEIIVIALFYLNQQSVDSNVSVVVNNAKWYVYKRIDGDYLLCGDEKNINNSNRLIMIRIETIIESGIVFEKINKRL